eukprot:2548916-Rhodomonas_salina.1
MGTRVPVESGRNSTNSHCMSSDSDSSEARLPGYGAILVKWYPGTRVHRGVHFILKQVVGSVSSRGPTRK